MAVVSWIVAVILSQVTAAQGQNWIDRCAIAPTAEITETCGEAYKLVRDTGANVPVSEELYKRLIEGARSLGDFDGAILVSRAAIRRFPENVDFYYRLGVILLDNRDAAFEAYGPLVEATRLNPKHGLAQQRLGDALLGMRRYEESLASYQTAGSLLGDSWELALGKAQALRSLGRRNEALDALTAARKWESTQPDAFISRQMRGDVLLELTRFEDAAREFRELLAMKPPRNSEPLAWCGLARALEGLAQRQEAARACEQAEKTARTAGGPSCSCRR